MLHILQLQPLKSRSHLFLMCKYLDIKGCIRQKHSWANLFALKKSQRNDYVPKDYKLIYMSNTKTTMRMALPLAQLFAAIGVYQIYFTCTYPNPYRDINELQTGFAVFDSLSLTSTQALGMSIYQLILCFAIMKLSKIYTLEMYKDNTTGMYRALVPSYLPHKLKVVEFSRESLKPVFNSKILKTIPQTSYVLKANNKHTLLILPDLFTSEHERSLIFKNDTTMDDDDDDKKI